MTQNTATSVWVLNDECTIINISFAFSRNVQNRYMYIMESTCTCIKVFTTLISVNFEKNILIANLLIALKIVSDFNI